MGWNYRKSVNLGGGVRLNLSKSGIGISSGIKGFRVSKGPRDTRLNASIPGTGLFYTKNLSNNSSSNRKKAETIESRNTLALNERVYQYSKTVTNDYTGETRTLRARTQFELDQLVRLEEHKQLANEQRQRQINAERNMQRKVDAMNRQLIASQQELRKMVNYTLTVNDRIDWDKVLITSEYPPFHFDEQPPQTTSSYKLGFFKSLFMNEKEFELLDDNSMEIMEFEKRRNEAITKYLEGKTAFDIEKNTKNGEMAYLKTRFEASDKNAIERYISIVLTKSKYPVDFEHDFEVLYKKAKKTVVVNFLFQDIDAFPVIEKYVYDSTKNQVIEVPMKKEIALAFYTEILYSVGIRTIHEIFESVYTDSVDTVSFNGYIEGSDGKQCAFAMKSNRAIFETIDLRSTLGEIVSKIESRTIHDFTGYDQIIPFD